MINGKLMEYLQEINEKLLKNIKKYSIILNKINQKN